MNPACTYAGSLLTACFSFLILRRLMDAFFPMPSGNPLRFAAWAAYYLLQAAPVLGISIPAPAMPLSNAALVLIISSVSYRAGLKRRCIFSMLVCAVWMLVEAVTGIALGLAGMGGWEEQAAAYSGQMDAEGRDGVFRVSVVMYGSGGKNDA